MLAPMRRFWLVVGAALFVCSSSIGSAQSGSARAAVSAAGTDARAPAQESDATPGPTPTPSAAAASSESPRRLWDIVKVLPILFYTPETSVGFGVGTLFQFRMPGAVVGRR